MHLLKKGHTTKEYREIVEVYQSDVCGRPLFANPVTCYDAGVHPHTICIV